MAFEDVEKWTHLIRGREFQTVHFFCWIWCQNYAPCFIHAIWISKLEWPNGVAPFDVLQIYNVQPVAKKIETFYWESRCRQKGNPDSKLWLPHTNNVLRCIKQCHEEISFLSKLRIQHAYLFFLLFLYSITETFYWETKGKSKFKTYTHLDCYAQKLLWEARTNIMIKLLSISSENSKCMGLFRIESNVISRLSCLKELLVPKNCYSVEWIFIGPRSDHSLPMSVTDWLTDSRPC